jgi:hypothetical protein
MSHRADWFSEVSKQLGVEFDIPFTAVLSDGTRIQASARVRNFGAVNGMLLVPSAEALKIGAKQLIAEGYGYCVIDDLGSTGEADLDAAKEMLADWGWSGDPRLMPSWLR